MSRLDEMKSPFTAKSKGDISAYSETSELYRKDEIHVPIHLKLT